MRKLIVLCLLLALASESLAFKGSHSGGGKSSSKSSSKTVHVHGYYRKDGTYVAPYDRSAPGTASSSTSSSTPSLYSTPRGTPYRSGYMAPGYTPHSTTSVGSNGKIHRSKAARAAFMREHPCPATGRTSGRCRGYVVDHVDALACGGADDPSNMQWQTTAEGKAKDKTELWCK
jgi:hypothetical protein